MINISPLKTNPVSQVIKHGYINTYSKLSHNEVSSLRYKEKYKELNPAWDESQVLLSKEFRKHYGASGATILDAGCGNGNYIVDENRDIIDWACGIDLKPEFTTKNVCLDEIKYTSLEHLPYQDQSFNAVLSLWVLEHLENPQTVFLEIARVLKPGGLLFFATPNKNFFPLLLNRFFTKSSLSEKIIKRFYGRNAQDVFKAYYRANSIPTLKRLARHSKLEIMRLQYNFDPSYTSFNDFLFTVSWKIAHTLEKNTIYSNSPHIVGIFKKN